MGGSFRARSWSSNAKVIAILLRNGFDCKIKQKFIDPAGRYIGVQAQINDDMTATLANMSSVEIFIQTLNNSEKCFGLKNEYLKN